MFLHGFVKNQIFEFHLKLTLVKVNLKVYNIGEHH